MITLYSTNCPKCKVLEVKLKQLNFDFTIVDDVDEVIKFGEKNNIRSAPILVVNDKIFDFTNALNYIKEISKCK